MKSIHVVFYQVTTLLDGPDVSQVSRDLRNVVRIAFCVEQCFDVVTFPQKPILPRIICQIVEEVENPVIMALRDKISSK